MKNGQQNDGDEDHHNYIRKKGFQLLMLVL